ncbi:hypothetical protein GCM10027596_33680 [Nocardioides korecus]
MRAEPLGAPAEGLADEATTPPVAGIAALAVAGLPPLVGPAPTGGSLSEEQLVQAYLAELQVPSGAPSREQLLALHRAHVLRFPHDTIWKSRGRVPELTEESLVRAVVSGEGGGCVHLNSSFVWLLTRLGYDASLHLSRVQRGFDSRPGARPDAHAVVLVRVEGTTWFCDVGLGNGPLDCFPLAEGEVHQPGGFSYALARAAEPGRWVFRHDRRLAAIRLLDFAEAPARLEDFATGFAFDSTHPESPSLRHLSVNRRRVDGVSVLSGHAWVEHGPAGRSMRRVTSAEEWERLLREDMGLLLPGLTVDERDRLWEKAGRV